MRWIWRRSSSTAQWCEPASTLPAPKTKARKRARSHGGLSTKIHATADALGDPLRWILTNAAGAAAVIPPRSIRTEPRAYDRHLYKDRNLGGTLLQPPQPVSPHCHML